MSGSLTTERRDHSAIVVEVRIPGNQDDTKAINDNRLRVGTFRVNFARAEFIRLCDTAFGIAALTVHFHPDTGGDLNDLLQSASEFFRKQSLSRIPMVRMAMAEVGLPIGEEAGQFAINLWFHLTEAGGIRKVELLVVEQPESAPFDITNARTGEAIAKCIRGRERRE